MNVDETIAAARERLEALIAPIDGGAGKDISYEPSFEAVKAEVDKLQALEGGLVDWQAVSSGSRSILEEESKDFRVLLYYVVARAKLDGAKGFFEGLVVLEALVQSLWEPMYPPLKRPRARGNLCPWVSDSAAPLVDAWNPTGADRSLAQAIEKVFRSIDNDLSDKLGEAYPGMRTLGESVRRAVLRLPAEAPPPPPPPPPPEPKAAPPAGSPAPESSPYPPASFAADPAEGESTGGGGWSTADIQDDDRALSIVQEMVPLLQRASEVLRATDPGSPEALRWSRVAATLFLNASLGEAGAQTGVNPPGEEIVAAAMSLSEAGDWQQLAELTENAFAANPVWLDGFYYAALAYENLERPVAKAVVESEAVALVKRSPNLEQLLFADGSPMASDTAKAWLAGLAGPGGGGAAAGGDKDPIGKAFARAQELIAAGDPTQAIATVEKVAKAATTAATRFRAKLKAAEVALATGYPDLARAQLDGLDRAAQVHKLAEWDPELVVQLYALLYRCQVGLGYLQSELPEQRARAAATWEGLCQLDGATALRTLLELG